MENYGVEPMLSCFYLTDTIVLTFERIGEAHSQCLCIDRQTFKLTQKQLSVKIIKESLSLLQTKITELFLGLLYLKGIPFLLFVEQAKQVCQIEGYPIYEITRVTWASIRTSISSAQLLSVEENIQSISELIENGGYYYCRGYDLTCSKQYASVKPDHQEKFMWNHHLTKQLHQQNFARQWTVPIIQGFVKSTEHIFAEHGKLKYILISRRSSKRAGTRFYSRGIDDLGQVSNFVESQQLIYLHNLIISHVQIRGSVPVFWQQIGIDGLASSLQINRKLELTESAFQSHFVKLRKTYKRFLCINLLSLLKQPEAELTQFFEKCIQKSQPKVGKFVKYQYFDFHQKCKGEKFANCNPLINKLKAINESFKFYCYDENTKQLVSRQQGVIRTNCLDCLDRTNFIQTKLAIQTLQFILNKLGLKFPTYLHEDMDLTNSSEIVQRLKLIWADNGDMISRHYTDIGSTHTDVTRQGKRTLLGLINHKWKSLNRFYKQFTDIKKQEAINILLGKTLHQSSLEQNINRQLKERERHFSSYLQITFYIVTWNVSGHPPVAFMEGMFNFTEDPVFVVIGLQGIQTRDGLMGHLLKKQSHKDAWINKINEYLCEERGYINVSTYAAGGCILLIYCKCHSFELQLSQISSISHCKLKLNMFNNDRNIILTRMKVLDTSLLFANCYFTKATDLILSSQEIHEKAFQQINLGQSKEGKITNIDYKFIFGNVGESIACHASIIKDKLDQYRKSRLSREQHTSMKVLNELSEADILNKQRYKDIYLENYSEGPLIFLPTSLIDIDRTYSDEQKPSWSQRILAHNDYNSILKQQFYKSLEIFETGHLPVASLYSIELKLEDLSKLKDIKNKLTNEL